MIKKITDYNFPNDLKTMSEDEMGLLCVQLREFLIDKVSKTGGHLASSLGAVELTVALHRCFNTPEDKIVWDVGHQAYVHKILTGRAKSFDTLRQLDGMSGFPKSRESEHDAFDTGHSSTSISACYGMAAARDIKDEKNEVIAVIGDGSLTGGMAFEALNNIGDSKTKVIVVLNDNGMSISPNVGGLSKHLFNLRTSSGYRSLKARIKDFGQKSETAGRISRNLANFKNDIKYLTMGSGILFEELGFTYFGPVDGHDLAALNDAFEKAKNLNEPVFIHVITRKGKGYRPAELNPGKFHGVGPFDPETGIPLKKPENPTYSELAGKFILKEADKDHRVCAITAAMREATGLLDFSKIFPERFFDCGIAEQHAVTFACGLAKEGMKPIVCIYSSFLQRAYDQIVHDCCMQHLPVIFMIDRAGVVGQDGETHHGVFDITYLSSIPNMTILSPSDGNELEAMLSYALTLDGPCAIRYPRGEAEYDSSNAFEFNGKNQRIYDGKTVDIWASGKFLELGIKVAEKLKEDGYEAGLVNVMTIKPLDTEPLQETGVLVSIEDNTLVGGMGQALRKAAAGKFKNMLNFGWPDEFVTHGKTDELMERYGLTVDKIVNAIEEVID